MWFINNLSRLQSQENKELIKKVPQLHNVLIVPHLG